MSFYEIVLERQITEGDSNFLLEIIKQLISGIAIGTTLALIGYFIWKRQNIYSKKFDAYISLISSLSEIYRLAFNTIIFENKTFFEMPKLKNFNIENKDFLYELHRNKLLFITFFGEEYLDKIEYFIYIEKNIEAVNITIKRDGGTFARKIKPEEYTPEILNQHKQQVINTMAEYLNDLKSVDKTFKKYIL